MDSEKAMKFKTAGNIGCYWRDGEFLVRNHRTRANITADPLSAHVLGLFTEWTDPREAAQDSGLDVRSVENAATALHGAGLLLGEDDDGEEAADERLCARWGPWAPEGAAFHFATRNEEFADATDEIKDELVAGGRPALFTTYPEAERLFLPRSPVPLDSPFEKVLYARRTHRAFADRPIAREHLAALLSTSFGPKDFIAADQFGTLMLRTSPSGGARHELEAYVAVFDVEDVAPGVYHYGVRDHCLELVARGDHRERLASLCGDQQGVAQAGAAVVLTAVIDRLTAKYRHPRAYRVMLMNAGHLAQTFALTATALGLGPFQTAAFHDEGVEDLLGVDGITEPALYVLAVGTPAADAQGRVSHLHGPTTLDSARMTRFDGSGQGG
ncbi:SagB-type dehydrogenase family enzyme [Nocardiopsis mwathae]|uniref:SagB-type dehydrogenase family enzyme n=1 Tax=Nocardiopsis mwathae TaxID=1472723 RepID=A0A7W9YG87_9ACTN|nr:SagB/ThcOx family dehydrogenase [Nocardiopsis mwathae]MBB6170956.1 SagB-type dehydrogenase family enzyme [Nocardiopsis mwathae]